ncbi:hypothetical protein GW17_00002581 [Ensete ventricosum]|nr:hypothetical protein GW17_00002581 [Ensete ventricosum]
MPQVVEMLSKPMKLNDKELTPPGVVGGSFVMNRVPEATISSNPQFKESTTGAATAVKSLICSVVAVDGKRHKSNPSSAGKH